jgi:hypothetical protein
LGKPDASILRVAGVEDCNLHAHTYVRWVEHLETMKQKRFLNYFETRNTEMKETKDVHVEVGEDSFESGSYNF